MRLKVIKILCSILIISNAFSQDTLVTKYPNTNQKWEKIYIDDEKTSENIYHENATPWMTVEYNTDSEEDWKWYYENGSPYFEGTIVNDLLQGTYKIWYKNGQLAESLFFNDNLENGLAMFYHESGQLAMKGMYYMGKMVGDWQFYDEDGRPFTGYWKWKFAASMEHTRMEGELKDGERIGKWIYRTTADQDKPYQQVFEEFFPEMDEGIEMEE